jgi:class 3 adenylate cyclase/tetratricopeptide (TPR) repeat protein
MIDPPNGAGVDTVAPPAVADRAAAGDGPAAPAIAAPELRTFLFADVRGYTRFTQEQGDEAAAKLVAKFAALMRQGVEARGGEVIELRGDEALAVFSSARQALRAAVELESRFRLESEKDASLPLPVGIGLDAGEAVPVEGGYRGEALNLASRLCNLAGPGEVLATQGVVYLGRRVQGVTYAERGLVEIKGFADPVLVIRVIRNGDFADRSGLENEAVATLRAPPDRTQAAVPIGGFLGALPSGVLVGRETEWNRIMQSMEAVMQGTGRLLLISGEPGIGKTRMAQEVTLKARHWGFLVATGRCYEQEQAVPYYPFLEALVTLYETCSPSVRAEIPRRWAHLGRLLPDQVGLLPVESKGHEDQHLLFRAVTGFIEAIAETVPVALLFDDLHWADDSSLKLLQYLARYTPGFRVLLLGTYRDVDVRRQHPLEAALLDLGREQLVEEVELRRLDQEGTAALLAEILGDKDDLTDLAELVYRRTDGNAFFVQEMLRALVERGDLYRENGRWEIRKVQDMEVPKSIRSVIGQRLSRLEEQAQEILREASVLGQEFIFDDLLALNSTVPPARPRAVRRPLNLEGLSSSAWTEDDIEGALEQAMLAGLVREVSGDTFAFNHALTQQALYAELSTRRRKRLHLAAGRALERLPTRDRERRAGELAWHFLEGDDAEQALKYALLAGDLAERVFANREADQHYRTALELARELEDTDREVEALEKLAGILTMGARYDQALEMLEEAAQLHRATENREGEACAVAQMGHVYYLRNTPEEGIARLRPLIESLERELHERPEVSRQYPPGADDTRRVLSTPSFGLAALWAAFARLYVDSGNYREQLRAADRAVELAKALKDNPKSEQLLLGAQVTRSDALWGLGQDDDALRTMEELIPRAEAAGDLTNLARALEYAGMYYARRGEFEKDRRYLERMLGIAERRGDRGQMWLGTMSLSNNAFITGDWEQARIYLDRAEQIIQPLSSVRLWTWPTVARGWRALRQGDLTAAAGYGEEALSLTETSGEAAWRRNAVRLLSEKDLLEGRPGSALARLETILDAAGWQEDAGFLRTLAMVHLELGNDSEAQDLATQAISQATLKQSQPELVETLVVQGMVMTRQWSWENAETLFTEGLTVARTIPFPYGEARALYEYGMMHAQQGDPRQARKRMKRALSLFERLGALKDVERTQTALKEVDRL